MLDRAWSGTFRRRRDGRHLQGRKPSRVASRPQVEGLESRELLAASIAPIPDVSVPAGLGYQVAVDGSASKAPSQTFTVTSSNPDIKATVAKGAFITVNVNHVSSGPSTDPSFSGAFTYQLFQDLTPNTAQRIQTFTNKGGYNGTSFFRVVSSFSGGTGVSDSVIQGGPQGLAGSGTNPLELNPQLAFIQPGSVAIANAGANTDGQQFFITNGLQTSLDFRFTIYGQVVSGQNVVQEIGNVATKFNTATPPEKSTPITAVDITKLTVSTTNPNGVIHIDATGATNGETLTITVTATDPADHTTATRVFHVTVGTLPPTTYPVTQTIVGHKATTIHLNSATNNAAPQGGTAPAISTHYVLLTQPTHGKITGFNATTGTLTYTPAFGFSGLDTFTYRAVNTGGSPATVPGNVATVSVLVSSTPIDTKAVRVIGNVLVVTPPPTTLTATNTIVLSQVNDPSDATKDVLTVTLNGKTDLNQPPVSSLRQVVVYGSKANDLVTIAPTVDKVLNVTLDGGHGGTNTLQAGAGSTREHGWFGHNTLIGGTGPNQLIGAAGHVRFKPTATTDEIFAGVAHPGYHDYLNHNGRVAYKIQPPGGTFYKFVNGHLTPIPTPKAGKAVGSSTSS